LITAIINSAQSYHAPGAKPEAYAWASFSNTIDTAGQDSVAAGGLFAIVDLFGGQNLKLAGCRGPIGARLFIATSAGAPLGDIFA
jgi:hypothetical protein